jgi:hypothetical protein
LLSFSCAMVSRSSYTEVIRRQQRWGYIAIL